MPFDSYHMDYAKGLMYIDCGDAGDREPDLKDPACLRAVLKHLHGELRVDGIILNHHREKHYGRKTLRALREIIALSAMLDELAAQKPLPNFPGLTRKEVSTRCDACPFNAGPLFVRLKSLLLDDLPEIDFFSFAGEFAAKVREMEAHTYKGCLGCTRRTADDLSFLLSEVEAFADRALARDRGK